MSSATTTGGPTVEKDPSMNYLTTVSGYTQWFDTAAAETFNSKPHSIEFTSIAGNKLEFSSTGFYPIDGRLYGNENQPHNRYFTYELEHQFSITSQTTLTFGATCSMWVGYCQSTTCQVSQSWLSDATGSSTLVEKNVVLNAGTYRLWIAFSNHCNQEPKLKIQIPSTNTALQMTCDVTTAGVVEKGLYPLTNKNLRNALSTATAIELLRSEQSNTFTSAWHATKFGVRRGFMTSFSYNLAGTSFTGGFSGFAFLVQNSGSQAQGDTGVNHYNNIGSSVVVTASFSSASTAAVTIQTRYSGDTSHTVRASDSCTGLSSTTNVYIRYIPKTNDQATGHSVLTVEWGGSCSITADLNEDSISDMWNPDAWVGFTAGISGTHQVAVTVSNWKLVRLQATGTHTSIAQAGVVWAKYGQHDGYGGATETKFNRMTSIVQTSFSDGTTVAIPASTSFTAYDPSTASSTNQLEIVYFANDTAMYQSVSADSSNSLSAFSQQYAWTSYLTGTAKQLTPSSSLPTSASYFIVPLDGCGDAASNSGGFTSVSSISVGTVTTTNSASFTCSSGSISVETASFCGVDVTTAVGSTCNGLSSCTNAQNGLTCDSGAQSWETNVFSVAYECYQQVAPAVQKTSSSVGLDAANFGFYQEIYGAYIQQTATGNYLTNVRFNGDSIGSFNAQVAYGDVSETYTTFTGFPSSVTAGSTTVITISAKDAFQNNQESSTTEFTVSFSQVSDKFYSTHVSGNTHTISVTLTEALTMQMYVRVNSKDVVGSPATITVNPAAATTANVILSSSTLSATNTSSSGVTATLALQDAYQNSITSGSFTAEVRIRNVSSVGPFTANSFTGSNVVISDIYYSVVGAYTLDYYVNNTKLAVTSSLTVLFGDADPSQFTLTGSSSFSVNGDSNYYIVQTRDQFGNQRTSQSGPFSVIFNHTSIGAAINVTCRVDAACVYQSQGAYRASFSPLVDGTWEVSVQGGASPTNFTVNPGPVSSQSQLQVTDTVVTANATGTFTITSKDSEGNIRDHVNTDGSAFIVNVDHELSSGFATLVSTSSGVNGVYTYTWRASFSGCAGPYLIIATLTDGTPIANASTRSVTVNPAATAAIDDLTGEGLGGVGDSIATSFTFKAYDSFDNLQDAAVVDTFNGYSDESSVQSSISIGKASGLNLYTFNYTAPVLDASSPEFELLVTVNTTAPGSLVRTINPTTIPTDSSPNYAGLVNAPTGMNPDTGVTLMIENRASNGDPDPVTVNPRTFFVVFNNSDGEVTGQKASCTIIVGGTNCNVTINGVYLPLVGTYSARLRVGASNYSPHIYPFTLSLGNTNAQASSTTVAEKTSGIIAGGNITMSAVVRDAWGNTDTTGARTVYFVVKGLGSQCNPSCEIGSSFSSGTYSGSIRLTVSGAGYSVHAREGGIFLGLEQGDISVRVSNASASTSTLGNVFSAATVFVVEEAITAYVTLRDIYGNLVSGETSSTGFSFTPSLERNNVSYSIFESSTGVYTINQLLPVNASTYLADGTISTLAYSVKIGEQDIASSPRSLTVQPGDVSASASSVTTVPANINAGDYFSLTVTLKDSLLNAWKQQIFLVRVEVSVVNGGGFYRSDAYGPGQNFLEPTPLGNGQFNYTIKVEVGNGPISYQLFALTRATSNYGLVPISGLASQTYVKSIEASAAQTVALKTLTTNQTSSTSGRSPFDAGFTAYKRIKLYDRFGNARQNDSVGAGAVTVRFDGHTTNSYIDTLMPSPFTCGQGLSVISGFEQTMQAVNVSCSNSTGECLITIEGIRSGNFRMIVFVNGVGALCEQFTVLQGPPSAPGSSFDLGVVGSDNTCSVATSTDTTAQTVGAEYCALVYLSDAYGNRLQSAVSEVVTIGNLSNPSSRSCSYTKVDGSGSFNVGMGTHLSNGVYDVRYSGTQIGTYSVVASIGREPVGVSVAQSCKDATFVPWYVYKFFPSVEMPNYITTKPSTLNLIAQDLYGNNVTSGSFSFSMTLNLYSYADASTANDGLEYVISVATSTLVNGMHQLSFSLEWPGVYRSSISLNPDSRYADLARFTTNFTQTPNPSGVQSGLGYVTNLTATSINCAVSTNGVSNYRCGDDEFTDACVASYSSCSGVTVCSGSTPIYCPGSSSCVASISQCACINTTLTRCKSGACVIDASTCMENGIACDDSGLFNCAAGAATGYPQCVQSSSDCPSPTVCPPGLLICDDGVSCAANTSACPASSSMGSGCPAGQFACYDGRCVQSAFDCPSKKTCPTAGNVVCSDGSCQADVSSCPSQYMCYDGQFRCHDGSCVENVDNCPSSVTCSQGYVLCENNMCAKTKDQCKAANSCPLTKVRCKDGSCVEAAIQCPTSTTCPASLPVLRDDGTCNAAHSSFDKDDAMMSLRDCNAVYGLSSLVTCPFGYCANSFAECPTHTTCPESYPVKCPDGSCQKNSTVCEGLKRDECPSHFPMSCPDGSCKSDISQCPSWSRCPAGRPVRCEDGSCVSSAFQCKDIPSMISCPPMWKRCPLVGCAPTFESCPTEISCPLSSDGTTLLQRCVDGTCRSSCSSVAYVGCETSQVTCPAGGTGIPTCASSLFNCPSYYKCPENMPVLCNDNTCAFDSKDCPSWPSTFDGRVPCADGGWALQASSCGTPVSCPSNAPYKCPDETCRSAPGDCVDVTTSCPEAKPYRCNGGECFASLTECQSTARCTRPAQYPVKCAAVNSTVVDNDRTTIRCVASVEFCDDAVQSNQNDVAFLQTCPNRWSSCRDGTCVEDTSTLCESIQCPRFQPFLCKTGKCVSSVDECPEVNGCPHDRPYKCTGGSCVSRGSQCPTTGTCASNQIRCSDGSCIASTGDCALSDGCLTNQLRCMDGSCISFDDLQFDNTNQINYCTFGQVTEASNNACPAFQPVRCPGGQCVASENLCPKTTYGLQADTCAPTEVMNADGSFSTKNFPVMCTDGSCVESEIHCPTLHACTDGFSRCGDGSCRLAALCPTDNTCPTSKPYRCSNGACASSLDYCVSPTSQTGCPCRSGQWDTENVYCVNEQVKCQSSVLGGLCGDLTTTCQADESNYPRANGCNSTSPIKCWNGQCVVSSDKCLMENGCPSSAPLRCADGTCGMNATSCSGSANTAAKRCGDGAEYLQTTAGAAAACTTYANCPVSIPYRCGDGSCKKYRSFKMPNTIPNGVAASIASNVLSQACMGTLVCPDHEPYRCADYSCATSADTCPPTFRCNISSSYICPDLSCVMSADNCTVDVKNPCPASSPILCPDGACRDKLASCKSEVVAPTCSAGKTLCFDGSCRDSPLDCIEYAYLVNNQAQTSYPATTLNADNDVCPAEGSTKMSVCPDGSCVPLALRDFLCEPTPACPSSLPHRCPDSTCVANGAQCSGGASTRVCSSGGSIPCSDGTCRTTCVPTNGCHGDLPYYCPTSTNLCVAGSAQCTSARPLSLLSSSSSSSSSLSSVLGQISFNAATARIAPTCTSTDCNREAPVTSQTFQLTNYDLDFDIAISARDLSARASIYIPSGSILVSDAPGNENATFTVERVSDEVLRSAVTYIHRSRKGDFDSATFTAAQTVLSPAFKCSASQDPFNFEISFRSLIDNYELINPGNPNKTDICLATLTPSSQSWVCISELVAERDLNPITNTTETRSKGRGTGWFKSCKDVNGEQLVFAFAHIPKQASVSNGSQNLWYLYQIIIVLCIVGGLVIILTICWCTAVSSLHTSCNAMQRSLIFCFLLFPPLSDSHWLLFFSNSVL
eukprot:jgi/Bigna1/145231/aug1.96_g19939